MGSECVTWSRLIQTLGVHHGRDMKHWLSVNFRKPYAAWVGWSKEQGEQPGRAALEFHRCCSQILERV